MLKPNELEETLLDLTNQALGKALEDWEMQVGFASKLGVGEARMLRRSEDLETSLGSEPYLEVTTCVAQAAAGVVRIFLPVEAAWLLLRDVLCLPSSAERDAGEPLDETGVEALQEMMNLLCGSANVVYGGYGLRLSQSVDDLRVEQHAAGVAPDLRGLTIRFPYEIEGAPTSEIVQVMPVPLALAVARAIRSQRAA
ncbi:MAG: hypothetical protein AAGB93_14770 [Planctomycetota bacterium]